MTASIKVLGISNAVVDVLTHVEDKFLAKIGAPKGSMTLIDEARAQEIYGMIGPATEMSGGSVANTIAGIATLGAGTAYIGRVANDQLGQIFIHDMRSLGVDVRRPPAGGGAPTARSYILITPDGQRTMQTYFGAFSELDLEDVNEGTIGMAEVMLLEGYVWDIPLGLEVMTEAMKVAAAKGIKVAISLSDALCVGRHRVEFLYAIENHADIVIANEREIMSLFEVESFESAMQRTSLHDCLFVVTRSEKGSVIANRHEKVTQKAYPVEEVVDTTGAGDAYAAAFLYAWTAGQPLAECADLGSRFASAVIQQIGPRLERFPVQ